MGKAENHPPATTGKKEDAAFAVCRQQEEAFRLGNGRLIVFIFRFRKIHADAFEISCRCNLNFMPV